MTQALFCFDDSLSQNSGYDVPHSNITLLWVIRKISTKYQTAVQTVRQLAMLVDLLHFEWRSWPRENNGQRVFAKLTRTGTAKATVEINIIDTSDEVQFERQQRTGSF